MATEQQFCLRWNNHQSTLVSVFESLLENSVLVDCTLAADGQQLKAHKVVLSACSPYLETLLSQHYDKHPIIILKDVKYAELKAILDYMYRGEVNISQEQLGTFLKAAESLQIKGLTDSRATSESESSQRQQRSTQNVQQLPSMTSAIPLINRGCAVNPLYSEKRKPGLVIPSHVIENPPHSPLTAREGSISPTVRKRKKPNLPNQEMKLNHQTVPDSCTTNPVIDCEESSHIDGSITEPQISSSANQNKPDNVPDALSIKTETIKTESTDDSVPMDDDGYENNENENLNEDDTMDLSAGPSRRFLGQGFNGKAHASNEGSIPEAALSSEDTQNTSEDTTNCLNHAYFLQQRKMLQNAYALNTESQTPAFQCQTCGKVYNRKGNLGRHVRYECGKGPQFSCNLCEKRFFRREKLALHVKNHELFQQRSLQVVHGQGRISI